MFLKSIRLKNCKCFDDLELTFAEEDGSVRSWTVLLGENGTGKSTLLKAIAVVTSGSNALGELLEEPSDWIRYRKTYCELEAVLVTQELEERHLQVRINKGDTITDVIVRNLQGLDALDRALKYAERNYFVVGFGASRRLSPDIGRRAKTSAFRSARAQNVATLFDADAVLNPLESWAMDLDYANRTGIRTIRHVLNQFLPDVTFHRIDKKQGRLLFKTPDGIVPLQALSDGYQNIAAWVGDLLYRITEVFEDYRNPLNARGLLLIDEVDLHLHPNWQRELLAFLGNHLPNFQCIVTTHSPVTAQQAGQGHLHYLTREDGSIRIEPFSGAPSRLLINQLLMSDAFGVVSDESLDLQQKKDRYRELRDQDHLSANEEAEMADLMAFLQEQPTGGRSNVHLHDAQVALLQKIERELAEPPS